jgi:hypothetical protein
MARNPVRDERQGDLFGAPPSPAKPARRTSPPKLAREEVSAPEPVSLSEIGNRVTKPEIDEFMSGLPDQKLAYPVVEATRLVKRRLTRGQRRGFGPKGPTEESHPLMMPFIVSPAS